ncbi:MAG: glycogen debranching N-terminal domain-containing protein [Gemmatimonadota bacterium]
MSADPRSRDPENAAAPLARLVPHGRHQYVSRGRTVLTTSLDGFIDGRGDHGLFVHETRLVSRLKYTIDGRDPHPVALSNVEQESWLGYYILAPPNREAEQADQGSGQMEAAAQQTLELRIWRHVGVGLHEDVDLTNYTREPMSFRLALELDGDFADLVEARSGERKQSGERSVQWEATARGGALVLRYRVERAYDHGQERGTARLDRGLRVEVTACPGTRWESGAVMVDVELAPGATWHACVDYIPLEEGEPLPGPGAACYGGEDEDDDWERRRRAFLQSATCFSSGESRTLGPLIASAVEAAKRDLAALRLYDLDHGRHHWVPAAGLPNYVALFGRDVLTAAWQMALTGPEVMAGALEELPRWQGREVDDWRDEEPGRMLHEAHSGPLEVLNVNPRGRYYGSVTTSPAYAVVLSEYWHWTGDLETVRRLAPHAMRAIEWMDRYGDRDGDGFYEYLSRSDQGTENQGWKDSRDAIVHVDGSQAPRPHAIVEEQGFAYLAKRHMSEVLWWLGEREPAKRLFREAGELKERFNERFWMEDEGFYMMGLDAEKRPIRSIGSNVGHCIATEIVTKERVPACVERLFKRDMFSGWGIRTLSADHPAYNPYSYHRGTVWPVEQASFALGFRRYDLPERVNLLARVQFDALALFSGYRLPEVFSGHERGLRDPFPALYPQTNSPQAWSASAVLCLLQAMLGLYPYAPLRILIVDPYLPAWLPEITLHDLRVGKARVTLRFRRRRNGKTSVEVKEKRGRLFVVRQASPWSLTATWPERLKDLLMSLVPGSA